MLFRRKNGETQKRRKKQQKAFSVHNYSLNAYQDMLQRTLIINPVWLVASSNVTVPSELSRSLISLTYHGNGLRFSRTSPSRTAAASAERTKRQKQHA
jgi:hypothetical protein